MLAFGVAADSMNDCFRISEITTVESIKWFVKVVCDCFSEFLRYPNESKVTKILDEKENRGFPGMMGSINCMP